MKTETILQKTSEPALFAADTMPEMDLRHISDLTDQTGIIQHAVFSMPNRKEGYCIDDNARALLLMVWAGRDKKNQTTADLLSIYLSYIHYMQTEDGYFRNFMNYNKETPEARGSEDSFGRTIMALGYLINEGTSALLVKTGQDIFKKAYPHVSELVSIRGMANSIIGICQVVKYQHPDDLKRNMVITLADKMVEMYQANRESDWRWFEPVLTYDNAMLPLALLHAYEVSKNEAYLVTAFEAMEFLESKVFYDDILRPIGNHGWLTRGGAPALFDQQGIDVMAMVLYYQQAYRVTKEQQYIDRMYKSYQWFLGRNDLGLPLYDLSTGGCADGLHSEGVNLNEGAESTLAYWISHVAVASVLEE